jgi:hypothetical protein
MPGSVLKAGFAIFELQCFRTDCRNFGIEVDGAKFRQSEIRILKNHDCNNEKYLIMTVYMEKTNKLLFTV